MSIIAAELVWRLPEEVSDDDTNGGKMTATAIPTAVKNNIFPDVPQSERTAGSTKYRKIFIHVANDADLSLIDSYVFVESQTAGDDNVVIFAGTFSDTQVDISFPEFFGEGKLDSNISAAATELSVLTEDVDLDMFRDAMKVRISDKSYINGSGNEEFVTIVGSPSYTGDVATFTFTPAVDNGYSATNTKVSGMYYSGTIAAATSNWIETSAGDGTYNEGTYPLDLDHISSIYDDWTLTFTSSTAFTVVGASAGTVGSGTKSGDFSPNNGDFSKPFFTLRSAGWAGTWATGDTITFTTEPAAIPVWYQRVVPAGASSLSGNSFIVAVQGESE